MSRDNENRNMMTNAERVAAIEEELRALGSRNPIEEYQRYPLGRLPSSGWGFETAPQRNWDFEVEDTPSPEGTPPPLYNQSQAPQPPAGTPPPPFPQPNSPPPIYRGSETLARSDETRNRSMLRGIISRVAAMVRGRRRNNARVAPINPTSAGNLSAQNSEANRGL